MKQYDYIFHPDPKANGEWTVQGMDLENECVDRSQGPLICMTIEELRECFDAGAYSQEDTKGSDECFTEYLKEKGIQL